MFFGGVDGFEEAYVFGGGVDGFEEVYVLDGGVYALLTGASR